MHENCPSTYSQIAEMALALNLPIRLYLNNMTNLRHHALHHGHRVVTIDYCDVTSPYLLHENMTSSIKLEVHNLSHCCQKRTDPRPRVTCMVKFGRVVFEICERTSKQKDRHTDTQIAILRTHTGAK